MNLLPNDSHFWAKKLFPSESSDSLAWGYLFLLGLALYAGQSWVRGLFPDGHLYAGLGRNAAELGHWLVPHFSSQIYPEFYDHQPFVFILEGLFFKLFGASYTTARLFVSLFGLATLAALLFFTSKLHSKKLGYLAGLLFITIPVLIKKTRFPNLDIPLMFFLTMAFNCYFLAYKSDKLKWWMLGGLFIGLALSTKGPIVVFFLGAVFMHLLLTRSLNKLAAWRPWAGLGLAFFIASLWPLALYLTGRFDIFEKYLTFTFKYTISGSRGIESINFFQHFMYLVECTLLWLVAFGVGAYITFKQKIKHPLVVWHMIYFGVFFLALSLNKVKYSNYLIPLYPSYALVAAVALNKLSDRTVFRLSYGIKILTILLITVLLIFPLTNKIRRGKVVFTAMDTLKTLELKANQWGVFEGAYPFHTVANLAGFNRIGEAHLLNPANFVEKMDNFSFKNNNFWVLIFKKDQLASLPAEIKEILKTQFKLFFNYRDLVLFIHKQNRDENLQ